MSTGMELYSSECWKQICRFFRKKKWLTSFDNDIFIHQFPYLRKFCAAYTFSLLTCSYEGTYSLLLSKSFCLCHHEKYAWERSSFLHVYYIFNRNTNLYLSFVGGKKSENSHVTIWLHAFMIESIQMRIWSFTRLPEVAKAFNSLF